MAAQRSGKSGPPVRLIALCTVLAMFWLLGRQKGSATLSPADVQALCSTAAAAGGTSSSSSSTQLAGTAAAVDADTAHSGVGDAEDSPLNANYQDESSSGEAGTDSSGSSGSGGMRHIYVVGCGHSGTSLLKRSIAHLPGLHCIPKETWAYERMREKPEALVKTLAKWDRQAAERGFTGWVEKTPSHVKYLGDIFARDPSARVVFIVRDGRDVAASFIPRGFPWKDCMGRWVKDNTAALPYLNSRPGQLLVVRFEDFFSSERVLGVMRQLAEFVGSPATTDRLMMALQPSTVPLYDDDQCHEYTSEAEKSTDLAASYLALLGNASALAAGEAGAAAGGVVPDQKDHKAFRSWQSSLAWAPQTPRWQEKLNEQQQADVAANEEMQQLLERFGYS